MREAGESEKADSQSQAAPGMWLICDRRGVAISIGYRETVSASSMMSGTNSSDSLAEGIQGLPAPTSLPKAKASLGSACRVLVRFQGLGGCRDSVVGFWLGFEV
eukprot:896874-Prorocentrum_minimum.AAC.1